MIGAEHGAMHCKQVNCMAIFFFFNAKLTIKKRRYSQSHSQGLVQGASKVKRKANEQIAQKQE